MREAKKLLLGLSILLSQSVWADLSVERALHPAETRESVLRMGTDKDGFYGSLFLLNGHAPAGSDPVGHMGADLGLADEAGWGGFDIGFSVTDTIAHPDRAQDSLGVLFGTRSIRSHMSAWGAYGLLNVRSFTFIAEYAAATERFRAGEFSFNGRGARPGVWNLEAGYSFKLFGKESTFAMGYQGTREALSLGLADKRYLMALSTGINENTMLSFEWAHEKDYDRADSGIDPSGIGTTGSGESSDTLTIQLGVEF